MAVDPCFADLLADKRNELRPPPAHITLDMMRAANKSFLVSVPKTPVHSVTDLAFAGPYGPLALRVYRASPVHDLPVILFCHGGGFVLGDLDTHDLICQRLAHSSSAVVVSINYRLAPESQFPRPVEECHAALAWIVAHAGELGLDAQHVALCGDSAGANLAIATSVLARTRGPDVHYLALLYPMVDPACDTPSMHEFARGYLLTRDSVKWSWGLYLADPNDTQNPLVAPMHAEPAAFPPTTIVTAGCDPLRDEGETFAARLQAAGVEVILRRCEGMVHGFAALPHLTFVANRAIDEMAADIAARFASREP